MIPYLTLSAGGIFLGLCFWILSIRVFSTTQDALLAQSTGGEALALYGIYKVWNGEPVYQWSVEQPPNMAYNFLFYYSYGLIGKLFVKDPELLPLFSKFFAFSAFLCLLISVLSFGWKNRKEISDMTKGKYVFPTILLFSATGLMGPFFGWFHLSARPDIAAVSFEIIALIFFLHLKERGIRTTLIVTVFFFLAWSFKQTSIFIWLGVLSVHCFERRWQDAILSVAIFSLLCLCPFILFGQPYIERAFIGPISDYWSLGQAINVSTDAFLVGSYIYLPTFFLISQRLNCRKDEERAWNSATIIFIITLLGNMWTSGKIASSRSYFTSSFSAALVCAVDHFISNRRISSTNGKNTLTYILLLAFVLGLSLSSAYLIFPNQVGRITLLNVDQRRGASQLRNLILSSKKPVFVEHNYFALPWNSGQNPTEILAGETTRVTSLTKLSWFPLRFPTIEYGPGLEDRIKGYIRTQYYAEAFVFKENKWCHLLEESGYRKFSFHGNLVRYIR